MQFHLGLIKPHWVYLQLGSKHAGACEQLQHGYLGILFERFGVFIADIALNEQ